MSRGRHRVNSRDINEGNVLEYVRLLDEYFDRAFFPPGHPPKRDKIPVIDEEFAASLISALSKSASRFMIAARFTALTDNLVKRTMQMSRQYRPLAIDLILQLFQVAGKSMTDLQRGQRRLQIVILIIECQKYGIECDHDLREQLMDAVKYARRCIRDLEDYGLLNDIMAVAKAHNISLR